MSEDAIEEEKVEPRSMPKAAHGRKDNITVDGEGQVNDKMSGFRFGRMFKDRGFQPVMLRLTTCITLGDRMTSEAEADRGDSQIPAGYTYFGQFVDHDVSFDGTENEGDDPATDVVEGTPDMDLVQERSPSLDLDSLYGGSVIRDKSLFIGAKFRIGTTSPSPEPPGQIGPVGRKLPYDLPRKTETKSGKMARIAAIGDARNDENLAVAQTHLMWLKFHNHVVDRLRIQDPATPEADLFSLARDLVIRHYQHVVLHDFVKRIINKDVYEDIILNGNRKNLEHCSSECTFMPLEFSVAAYRYGHSQVREEYDWNVNFGTGDGILGSSPFSLLFDFTERSGNFRGFTETLPTNWIADFRRLYDFDGAVFPHLAGSIEAPFNAAKKIDPFIAPALGQLPSAPGRPSNNLAALNLRRGSMRGLPSGQDVSRAIPSVKMLTKAQMRSAIDPDFDLVMENSGLYERTPLWLYVLLEAAVVQNGERLGPLGSTIVADTFRTLVLTSRTSVLKPGSEWTPEDAISVMGGDVPLETIPQILMWMDAIEPIIDPLQDNRLKASM